MVKYTNCKFTIWKDFVQSGQVSTHFDTFRHVSTIFNLIRFGQVYTNLEKFEKGFMHDFDHKPTVISLDQCKQVLSNLYNSIPTWTSFNMLQHVSTSFRNTYLYDLIAFIVNLLGTFCRYKSRAPWRLVPNRYLGSLRPLTSL